MAATTFLEHDNASFSKILLSKEVADIIKQVVKESTNNIHLNCNDGKNFKGIQDYNNLKFQCSPNCWCKKEKSGEYLYS